ncbi:UNVERIFIED_CONTAM: Boron transporter 4 [Sesamum radiatum]|uniref:Boron transporter 4 n=1 Tax=Sesamum radiatum TaxID=300843 RepID=A0AAW2JSV3_SESRA
MDNPKAPLAGVAKDFKGRLACYKRDWLDSCGSRARILAPTAYIFFASALPVIAFGEQLSRDTEGTLSPVETLASTAICGVIHTVFGGQPLLILGVAEPTIIMYHYLYDFGKSRIGRELYFSLGRVGVVSEFSMPEGENATEENIHSECFMLTDSRQFNLLPYLHRLASEYNCRLRGSTDGHGLFTAIRSGRLNSALSLDSSSSMYHWTVAKDMGKVPAGYIFAAIIPALMIAGLYFFDHCVASQLAQQSEFNLTKPTAYHYDILLLGVMTLICGLLGLPPSNGVLPQSPMHTKSLVVLKKQVIRDKMVKCAKEGMKEQVGHTEIYKRMHDVFVEMDSGPTQAVEKELADLKEAVVKHDNEGESNGKFDPEKCIDLHLPVRVNEQESQQFSAISSCGACYLRYACDQDDTNLGFMGILRVHGH